MKETKKARIARELREDIARTEKVLAHLQETKATLDMAISALNDHKHQDVHAVLAVALCDCVKSMEAVQRMFGPLPKISTVTQFTVAFPVTSPAPRSPVVNPVGFRARDTNGVEADFTASELLNWLKHHLDRNRVERVTVEAL